DRAEPDLGGARAPLRPLVEPRHREPGDRPRVPDRAEEECARPQVRLSGDGGGEDRRDDREQDPGRGRGDRRGRIGRGLVDRDGRRYADGIRETGPPTGDRRLTRTEVVGVHSWAGATTTSLTSRWPGGVPRPPERSPDASSRGRPSPRSSSRAGP